MSDFRKRMDDINARIVALGERLEEIDGDEIALREWHVERRKLQGELEAIEREHLTGA